MVRTTVSLPEHVLANAKLLAKKRGTTLSQVVADGLVSELNPRFAMTSEPFQLPVWHGKLLIDINKVTEMMHEEDVEKFLKLSSKRANARRERPLKRSKA